MQIGLSQIRLPLSRELLAILVHRDYVIHVSVRQKHGLYALDSVLFQVVHNSIHGAWSI